MHRRTRRLAGGAVALGAGAILIGPVGALAQTDDPDGSTPTTSPVEAPPATDGTGTAADAAPRWLADVLAPLVAAGTITQAQADAVVEAVHEARPALGEGGPLGPDGRRGAGPRWHRAGHLALETAAEAIGIGEDELRAALAEGQTPAEVAAANGVEPQAVVDALVAEARAALDEAVADGRLDEEQAAQRLAALTDRITTAVEEGFPSRPDGGPWSTPDRRHTDGDATEDGDDGSDEGSTTTDGAPTTTAG